MVQSETTAGDAHVQRKAVSIGYRRSPRDAALHMQAWGAKRVVVLSEDGTVAGMLRAEDLAPALDADEYVGSFAAVSPGATSNRRVPAGRPPSRARLRRRP